MSERLSIVKILGKLEEVNVLTYNVLNIHSDIKNIKEQLDLV